MKTGKNVLEAHCYFSLSTPLSLSLYDSLCVYLIIYPYKYIVIVDVAVLKDSTMSFPSVAQQSERGKGR